ncbi:protein PEAK3 isoform X1 [Sminthopsis crassicaudata]|uniref:protein PEAK3 isoform X1 n=1 Tax=Sminthopsis crassicaudata TaxID=9301 RepID=UPI003D691168
MLEEGPRFAQGPGRGVTVSLLPLLGVEAGPDISLETGRPSGPAQQHIWRGPGSGSAGEGRAHLLPSKPCRPRTSRLSSTSLAPPPLPQKTLCRTRSLPTSKTLHSSYGYSSLPRREHQASPGQTPWDKLRKPLLESRSLEELPRGGVSRLGPDPRRLTFATPDWELGHFFQDLGSPQEAYKVLRGCQLDTLRCIEEQLGARLAGPWPGRGGPGQSFRLLDSEPCAESGDAWYYKVVRITEDTWHLLAAKVPKLWSVTPKALHAEPPGLALQATLKPHFNVQSLCGQLPAGTLPEAPWQGPAALVAEVPTQTVADWVSANKELHGSHPGWYERRVCLLLLQLCGALKQLHLDSLGHGDLRPENLLLAVPRGQPIGALPQLLLTNFARTRSLVPQLPAREDELQLGLLIYEMLGQGPALAQARGSSAPPLPIRSAYSLALARLTPRLLQAAPDHRPPVAQVRVALQTILWGPGPKLQAQGLPLGPWLDIHRALLPLELAERLAGSGEAAGLEDWLCCQYMTEASQHMVGWALELLWGELPAAGD